MSSVPSLDYSKHAPPPGPRTSGAAIASLVLGLLLCVPLLTSAAAILLGVIGIRRTRTPQYKGRGLAVAGLTLGIVGASGWLLVLLGSWIFVSSSAQPRQVARQFLTDLAAGNIEAAAAASVPEMPREDLESAPEALKQFGTLREVSFNGLFADTRNSTTYWDLRGTAEFDKQTVSIRVVLRESATGTYQVESFQIR